MTNRITGFINAVRQAENKTSFEIDEDAKKRLDVILLEHNKTCKHYEDGSRTL